MKFIKIELAKYQRENCEKLINYLLSGELKANFHMAEYADEKVGNILGLYTNNCGTVGCAVGHGPYAGIPKRKNQSWSSYSENFLTMESNSNEVISEAAWEYAFSNLWKKLDNTPQGAARRLTILVEYGLPLRFLERFCFEEEKYEAEYYYSDDMIITADIDYPYESYDVFFTTVRVPFHNQ